MSFFFLLFTYLFIYYDLGELGRWSSCLSATKLEIFLSRFHKIVYMPIYICLPWFVQRVVSILVSLSLLISPSFLLNSHFCLLFLLKSWYETRFINVLSIFSALFDYEQVFHWLFSKLLFTKTKLRLSCRRNLFSRVTV